MKTPTRNTTILILASALVALISTSCGTVRGFGRDVGTVGGAIQSSTR